MGISNSTNLDR